MSLRPLLNTIQKPRSILFVYKNWFRPVSLSAHQCSNKEEPISVAENAEPSLEKQRILDKRQSQKDDYEYYRKFVGIVKDLDKKTVAELKTNQVIEGKCHTPSITSILPETIEKNNIEICSVKDPTPGERAFLEEPDNGKFIRLEKSQSLTDNTDPTEVIVIPERSQEFSGPFIRHDELFPEYNEPSARTTDLTLPSDPAEAAFELSRRRYTQIEKSYNLAVYVNESETLKQLVSLGVDLSAVEKVSGAANHIIRLDFERDVKPYLFFLKDIGIPDDKLAQIITKNPLIFKTSIKDLQAIVKYFQSKNFSETALSNIVIRAPRLLLMPISRIDGKLGFYQKLFQLKGNDVREVISRLPKLVTYDAKAIKNIHFQMKEFLGFTNSDLKKIFLITPRVFLSNQQNVTNIFDYLHNEMGLSHFQLTQWPRIFRTRLHIIKQRHEFLKHMERHQYDPTKENYVSLSGLVTNDDATFCLNIAKSSPREFNQFLKTL